MKGVAAPGGRLQEASKQLFFLKTKMSFDAWLTVHLNSVKITKLTRCHFV